MRETKPVMRTGSDGVTRVYNAQGVVIATTSLAEAWQSEQFKSAVGKVFWELAIKAANEPQDKEAA